MTIQGKQNKWGTARILFSIIILLGLGTVLYTGNFVRDCFVIGGAYAVSLGIVEIVCKIFEKLRKRKK